MIMPDSNTAALNKYQAELDSQQGNEFKLAEAAKETLMAIDEIAGQMMQGVIFIKPGRNPKYPIRFGREESDYQDDPEYPDIIQGIANRLYSTGGEKLVKLMKRYCRDEAAFYLDADIDELESLVEIYKE
jgi:hypothetical protein